MKKVQKIFAVLLPILICVHLLSLSALAGAMTHDNLEILLQTNKSTYEKDESIVATLTVTNQGETAAQGLVLEQLVPEGYHAAQGEATVKNAEVLPAGETIRLTVTFRPDEEKPSEPTEPSTEPTEPSTEPTEPSTEPSTETTESTKPSETAPEETKPADPNNPGTGDLFLLWLLVALLSLAAIVFALLAGYGKFGRRILSLLLCVVLISSVTLPALATEADADDAVQSIGIYTEVQVDGKTVTLNAVVKYHPAEEVKTPSVALRTGETLTYDEDEAVYVLKGEQKTLTGTLTDGENVTEMSLSVEYNTIVVATYAVTPGADWTVENFGLFPGENTLHFNMTDAGGKVTQQDITIFCGTDANIGAIVEDTAADDDEDGLPDYIEELFGTDPDLDDTDGDGLLDGQEGEILGCDARKADTDGDETPDSEEDPDEDGLTNLKELELGTDPCQRDTDGDDLTDAEEVNTTKTNSVKADTDGDGMDDGWEVDNGRDPLTADAAAEVKQSMQAGGCTVEVSANLPSVQAPSLAISAPEGVAVGGRIPGKLSEAVSLTVEGALPESGATLSFQLDSTYPSEPTADFIPTIYYYNEAYGRLEEVPTTYSGSVARAHLTHFSTYILLNKVAFDEVWDTEIRAPGEDDGVTSGTMDVVLVIDSSGSMSSNDRNDLRLEAAKQFVEKLGEGDRAAVIDFDSSTHVLCGLTGDKEALNAAISQVNSSGGTSLTKGISPAIDMFLAEGYDGTGYRYIIMLTDGQGSYDTNLTTITKENGVLIYTIGLGSGVDAVLLQSIAEGTGGKYYFASTAEELPDIYEDTAEETIDYSTDSNGDGISDYYTRLIAEGRLRDGNNKRLFAGALTDDVLAQNPDCTDMAELVYLSIQSNADFDGDGLLNGEEIKIREYGDKVYVQMYSNPVLFNTDGDPFDDRAEVQVYGYDPMVFNLLPYHVDELTVDEKYVGAQSAQKFVDSGWYRVQLGLGNYVFGGEQDWKYAAEKQILAAMEVYQQQCEQAYQKAYVRNALTELSDNFLSTCGDLAKGWKIMDPVVDSLTHQRILGDSARLRELANQLGNAKFDQFTVQANIADTLEDLNANLKNLSDYNLQLDADVRSIHVKAPSWMLNQGMDVMGAIKKAGKVVEYATIVVDSWKAIGDTLEGHAALVACDEAYHSVYDLLSELEQSEIDFVSLAATELKVSLAGQFGEMASVVRTICKDVGYAVGKTFTKLAMEKALTSAGPWGWYITIGIAVSEMVSGIGETSKRHIRMITAGEAGRAAARIMMSPEYTLRADPVNERYEYLDCCKDVILLCAVLRRLSEEQARDAEQAREYFLMFWLYDNKKEFIALCNDRIDRVNEIIKFYSAIPAR